MTFDSESRQSHIFHECMIIACLIQQHIKYVLCEMLLPTGLVRATQLSIVNVSESLNHKSKTNDADFRRFIFVVCIDI